MPRHDLKNWPSIVQNLLECSNEVFKIDSLLSMLSFEHISSICSSLMSLFKFVGGEDVSLKEYKYHGKLYFYWKIYYYVYYLAGYEYIHNEFLLSFFTEVNEATTSDIVLKTALQITSVISSIESKPENIPSFFFTSARWVKL